MKLSGKMYLGFFIIIALVVIQAVLTVSDLRKMNVRRGGEISRHLGNVFQRIEGSGQNVGRLVGEIANAVNEQSAGIDQVATAMAAIDAATQKNAAAADMVRASSRDIEGETRKMLDVTDILSAIVHGARGRNAPMNIPARKMLPAPQRN